MVRRRRRKGSRKGSRNLLGGQLGPRRAPPPGGAEVRLTSGNPNNNHDPDPSVDPDPNSNHGVLSPFIQCINVDFQPPRPFQRFSGALVHSPRPQVKGGPDRDFGASSIQCINVDFPSAVSLLARGAAGGDVADGSRPRFRYSERRDRPGPAAGTAVRECRGHRVRRS